MTVILQVLGESIACSDILSRCLEVSYLDVVQYIDSYVRSLSKSVADTVSILDRKKNLLSRHLVDSYTVSDIVDNTIDILFNELYNLSDVLFRNTNKALLDSVSTLDNSIASFYEELFEIIDLAGDIPSTVFTKILTELWQNYDSMYRNITKKLDEISVTTDSVIYGFFVKLLESYISSDTLSFAATKVLNENVGRPIQEILIDDFEDGNINNWTFTDGNWVVSTNAAYEGNYGLEQTIVATESGVWGYKDTEIEFDVANSAVECYVKIPYDELTYAAICLFSLWNDGKPSGYLLGILPEVTIDGNTIPSTVEIVRVDNGTGTSLKRVYYELDVNTWYKLKLKVNGSTIRGYLDDSLIVSVDDSTYPKLRYVGMYVYGAVQYDLTKAYTIQQNDKATFITLKTLQETNYFVDKYVFSITKLLHEINNFVDLCTKHRAVFFNELIQYADTTVKQTFKYIIEAIVNTDKKHREMSRNLSEQLNIDDVALKLLYIVMVEIMSLLDARYNIRLLTESFLASDILSKTSTRILSEIVNHTDKTANSLTKTIVDALNFADYAYRNILKKQTELLQLMYAKYNTLAKTYRESSKIDDNSTKTVYHMLPENVLFSDSVIKGHYIWLTEVLSIVDNKIFNNLLVLLKETLTYLDSSTKHMSKPLVDSATYSDVKYTNPVKRVLEQLSVVDKNILGWTLTEVASFKDTFSKTALFKYLKNKATSLVSRLTKSYPR